MQEPPFHVQDSLHEVLQVLQMDRRSLVLRRVELYWLLVQYGHELDTLHGE
jgi:hypothetical protein